MHRTLLLLTILALFASTARAEDRRPLRAATSENGTFMLELKAGRPGASDAGCRAKLLENERGHQRTRWARTLVNDVAPEQALIRDDGRFVVTLSEYRRGGARHALVIYGAHGELIRHFLLTDLLGKGDWKHVKADRRRADWLSGADARFDEEQFIIKWAAARELRIDLKTLRVIRAEGEPAGRPEDLPAELAALLFDSAAELDGPLSEAAWKLIQDNRAAVQLDQEDFDALAAAGLLKEGESIADMLRRLEGLGDAEVPDAAAAVVADLRRQLEEQAHAAAVPAPAPARLERTDPALADVPTLAPDEFSNAGIAMPLPNPANPVNYLDWLNEHTIPEGPDALPEYRAAIESAVFFDGDASVLSAALSGDPDALAAPEIQSYLSANQAALEHFRQASGQDFRGWKLQSDDGSMISALLPHLAPLRQVAKAAVLNARLLAANGQPQEAVSLYADTLAAGADVGQGVTLIENLVGIAVQQQSADALLDLLDTGENQLDFLQVAQQLESSYQPTRPMNECIQFERATLMDTLQRVFEVDDQTGEYRVNLEKVREVTAYIDDPNANPIARMTQAFRLATMNYDDTLAEGVAYYDALSEAVSLPYPQARQAVGDLERVFTDDTVNPLLQQLTPALSRAQFLRSRAETTRRATLLIANLKAYRQQHGVYPDSLGAFGSRDFAIDPFSDAPFRYERDGAGFRLYSLGDNGQDDGGVHDPKAETNDVVYWPRNR